MAFLFLIIFICLCLSHDFYVNLHFYGILYK